MSKMATCPKCDQAVAVPDGSPPSAQLHCPQCEIEFPANDAPDITFDVGDTSDERNTGCEESDDKTGSPSQDEETEDGQSAEQDSQSAEQDSQSAEQDGQPTAEDEDAGRSEATVEEAAVRLRCPCCHAEFALEEAMLAARLDIPDSIDAAVSTSAFDFAVDQEDGADAASSSVTAFSRRKTKQKSMVREFTGIVLGGVAGLAIAYYGLNFFGGPRFDFLEVYLPGIEHTLPHRPSWLPGGEYAKTGRQDGEDEQGGSAE